MKKNMRFKDISPETFKESLVCGFHLVHYQTTQDIKDEITESLFTLNTCLKGTDEMYADDIQSVYWLLNKLYKTIQYLEDSKKLEGGKKSEDYERYYNHSDLEVQKFIEQDLS